MLFLNFFFGIQRRMSQRLAASKEDAVVRMHMPTKSSQKTLRSNFFDDQRKPLYQ